MEIIETPIEEEEEEIIEEEEEEIICVDLPDHCTESGCQVGCVGCADGFFLEFDEAGSGFCRACSDTLFACSKCSKATEC